MVTLLAADLDITAAAYGDYLGYEVVQTGIITETCAGQMGNPSMMGRGYINMSPPKGELNVVLRFIEGSSASYEPMQTAGWNAVELLAQDPDVLRSQMDGSPFKVIGVPAYLTAAKKIYAMQVQGPSGELLYLTHMLDPQSSLLKPEASKAPIGNTFIMVLGSSDLSETRLFVEGVFGNTLTDPLPFKIDVLAKARGETQDTLYPIMMMKFSGPFGFEFDQYGKGVDKQQSTGGIILVSASVDSLNSTITSLDGTPATSSCPGIQGQSELVSFPSGALLELVAP
jgi:hypothetical protein|tara:strand:- start:355 stop:1206 length:852 start_codon:yes stop_codon:yes gene_type:complete